MNQYVHAKLGGHNSIEAIIYSVNFERILTLVHRGEWESVEKEITHLAKKLETAGADFLILTANAIHKVFSQVEAAISIPILHIADPTAEAIHDGRRDGKIRDPATEGSLQLPQNQPFVDGNKRTASMIAIIFFASKFS